MSPLKEKILVAVVCAMGILLVSYGMITKNNPVFVLGIVAVIASYLVVRKKIKGEP